VLFTVDNTLATPALCRPLEFGVNIVVHSTTKYLDGHAAALGGMIVDGGKFNFKNNPRYPAFNTPDESYHGLVYADLAVAFGTKCRAQMIRDTGAIMSPQNAFLTYLGCDTLALRMERTSRNAEQIAEHLSKHPKIAWVKYSSLPTDTYHALARKYLPNGAGGMMSFGIKGTAKDCAHFMESLKLVTQETHVADVRSCVLHPASTTHRQLSDEQLKDSGIAPNLVRLSVGIENVNDIITDLDQALANV
ncbi:MAG: PLP-dependent transferase, partial [Clostridia bacterium]|nr:PLP-dependent transferase [Clostridia bacterium]